MVGGGFLIRTTLRPSPSSSFHIVMPLASFLCLPRATIFRRFNHDNYHHNHHHQHHHEPEERAPSTAEEFKRVAEEKLRMVKKAHDGTDEAGSNIELDDKKNDEHERSVEVRRRGDKDHDV